MSARPSLTAAEWHALASAIAERDCNLEARHDDHGEPVGRERAALKRAAEKVQAELVARRSWGGAPRKSATGR